MVAVSIMAEYFWRHVLLGTHAGVVVVIIPPALGWPGKPEITNFYVKLWIQKQVPSFQIPMNKPLVMNVLHTLKNLLHVIPGHRLRE